MLETLLESLPPMVKISLFQLSCRTTILRRANTEFPPHLKSIYGTGHVDCPSLLSDQVNIRYLILSLPLVGHFVAKAKKTVYFSDPFAKNEKSFEKL